MARAAATAASPMRFLIASSRKGDGVSSSTFWWRRWIEHSRSKRWTWCPWVSPNTWNSMWWGPCTKRSSSTRSSPNAFFASRRAAARDGLDEEGITHLLRLGAQEAVLLPLAVVARDDGHAGLLHDRLGAVLEAHPLDGLGRGADEDDSSRFHGAREALVLGKKAIPRMDGLRATGPRHIDDGFAAQVRLRRARAPDEVGLVGLLDVQRVRVDGGVDRDGADREAPAGADHAAGDLAAVGDEDLGEHGRGESLSFTPMNDLSERKKLAPYKP